MSGGGDIPLTLDLDAAVDEERNKYGINSPRAGDRKKNKPRQDSASDEPPAALMALATQVDRPDSEPMAVEPARPEANKAPAQEQSCWSALFCCCAPSLPAEPAQTRPQGAKQSPQGGGGPRSERVLPIKARPEKARAALPADLHQPADPDVAMVVDEKKPEKPAAYEALITQVPRPAAPAPATQSKPRSTRQTQSEEAGEDKAVELQAPKRDDADDEMPGVQQLDTAQPQEQPEPEEDEVSDSGPDPEGYLGPNTLKLPNGRRKKRCLVLDLDETLVHSSFKAPGIGDPKPDFIVPVVIDGITHKVYVLKRPYADEFLEETAKNWELVIFTASLSKYADPLLDMLDKKGLITSRLFREHCVLYNGNYVKDLTKVGRKLKHQVFVDNAPKSYLFQPTNAVPITSWFDDKNDTELRDIIPVLNTTLLTVPDVRSVLDANNKSFRWLCRQANRTDES